MPFTVLSIQSHVVAGHVGNDAAVFALQRLGIEVWPIHTVQFSNHPGHGAWTGQAFDAAHVRSLIDGLDARGFLSRVDAVLSGYVGTAETGAAIADAVACVKAQNARAIYCCDPVMGDVGPGLFVKPDVPPFFTGTALPLSDIVTPNVFELSLLTGTEVAALSTQRDLVAAARALIARGPRVVLHQPPFTSALNREPARHLQWPFAEWGASAVLAGHDHFYERLESDGIPYFVNGAGGGGLYALGQPEPQSLFRYNDDYGAMRIDAGETCIAYAFYNRAREVVDALVVRR